MTGRNEPTHIRWRCLVAATSLSDIVSMFASLAGLRLDDVGSGEAPRVLTQRFDQSDSPKRSRTLFY